MTPPKDIIETPVKPEAEAELNLTPPKPIDQMTSGEKIMWNLE